MTIKKLIFYNPFWWKRLLLTTLFGVWWNKNDNYNNFAPMWSFWTKTTTFIWRAAKLNKVYIKCCGGRQGLFFFKFYEKFWSLYFKTLLERCLTKNFENNFLVLFFEGPSLILFGAFNHHVIHHLLPIIDHVHYEEVTSPYFVFN